MLERLALAGDGNAAALAADTLADAAPERAYRLALVAGGSGALARLDSLERRLPLRTVLDIQRTVSSDLAPPEPGPARLWTEAARAAAEGDARPRDYRAAWRLAALAAAAGDPDAARLRDRLSRDLRAADAELWPGIEADLAEEALALWLEDEDLRDALGR